VRKKVGDKVKGAAIFFQQDSELATTKGSMQDSKEVTTQSNTKDSQQDSKQSNTQDTTQYTNNVTNKYTVEMPDKTELFDERLVSNVTKSQKKYVKDMGKKFENESAFVRYMIDYFRKNIEIK
jgi:hypothetical protein